MKKILFLLFLMAFSCLSNAQKEGAIWYFGEKAGLDFKSGNPVVLTDGAMNTLEGCSVISDFNGNLLFYTDGITVWNRNNQIMPNGEGLLGDKSSTQSAIIVPNPGFINKYYVFTVNANYHLTAEEGFNYSVVDLSLDSGNGDIVTSEKNIELLHITEEKLTAVKKSDTEYWVLTRYYDTFYTYKIDVNGLNPNPIETKIAPALPGAIDKTYGINSMIGYMKFSPDGTKLAVAFQTMLYAYENYTPGLGGVYIYDFDINTGVPKNPQLLSDFFRPYGLEFSPDSSKLYASTGFAQLIPSEPSGKIYQFDLKSSDIPASKRNVLTMPYGFHQSALQLAIDGKIYFTTVEDTEVFIDIGVWSEYMSVIENPNADASLLNINLDAVYLGGNHGRYGLPTFISSYFNIGFSNYNTCFEDTTEFRLNSTSALTSVSWDFGDGNSSTNENPSHRYYSPGSYTVSVTATTATESKTETREITIYANPVANPVTDYEVCNETPTFQFDLSSRDSEVLGNQSPTDFKVAYFTTQANAENGVNPLPALYANTNAVETIYARVYNTSNSSCYDIIGFHLVVKEAPVVNAVSDWTVCDTNFDEAYDFDLSQKDTEILNGQDAGRFQVQYFESQSDADAGINAIGPAYTNTSQRHELFFRIGNRAYRECYVSGSFFLEVLKQVHINEPSYFIVCDTDNDGFYTFDLTTKYDEIYNNDNPFPTTLTFYETAADLNARTNPLDPKGYTNTIGYEQTIWARLEITDHPDCFKVEDLTLFVYDSPQVGTVTDWAVCDDDNDGQFDFNLPEKDREILNGQSASGYTITYYETLLESENGQNPILGPYTNTTNPDTVYYRVENVGSSYCQAYGSINLQVRDTPIAGQAVDWSLCATLSGEQPEVDLSQKDTEILNGQDPALYEVGYFLDPSEAIANQNQLNKSGFKVPANQQTIYIRITHRDLSSCFDTNAFDMIINPLPHPDLSERYVICPDSPELTIDGGDFESWSWENAAGAELWTGQYFSVPGLGVYSLTVSESRSGTACEKTLSFEVVSSGAPDDFTYELDGFSDKIKVIIDASGVGEFEYSVDGVNFQDSPVLEVFPGEYTLYVQDTLLCRTISKDIIALGYMKFFTPNGDSTHDYWNVTGAENFPNSAVFIHDKYGKLIKQLAPSNPGWDGTFLGKPLPASDYWFRYSYGNGKTVTGHFALKR